MVWLTENAIEDGRCIETVASTVSSSWGFLVMIRQSVLLFAVAAAAFAACGCQTLGHRKLSRHDLSSQELSQPELSQQPLRRRQVVQANQASSIIPPSQLAGDPRLPPPRHFGGRANQDAVAQDTLAQDAATRRRTSNSFASRGC